CADVSEIVESFQRICRNGPDRPLVFLPGRDRTITASAIWNHRQEWVHRLTLAGFGAGDLVVSGTGSRPDLIAVLLACRSLDLALLAVDPGATRAEITQLGARFGAGGLVLPSQSAAPDGESERLDLLAR